MVVAVIDCLASSVFGAGLNWMDDPFFGDYLRSAAHERLLENILTLYEVFPTQNLCTTALLDSRFKHFCSQPVCHSGADGMYGE